MQIDALKNHSDQTLFTGAPRLASAVSRISAYCARNRIRVNLMSPTGIARALDLPEKSINTLADDLEVWMSSLESSKISPIEGSADLMALKSYFANTGQSIPEDFYSTVRSGDVVEVYRIDPSTRAVYQTWRNWQFLAMCSYDLLTLFVTPMHVLFLRDEEINVLMEKKISEILQQPRSSYIDIPAHSITEQLHSHNRRFQIKHRFAAPVLKDGSVTGFVSTLSASPLVSAFADFPNVKPFDHIDH